MKFVLVVGHTLKHHGASYGILNEYLFNTLLAKEISCYLGSLGHECFIIQKDDLSTEELVELAGYQQPKAIIGMHLNAFNEEIEGTETLFTRNHPRSGELARILQVDLCKALGRTGKRNRGVKLLSEHNRGFKNLCSYKNPACIIETFFIDNKNDLILGLSKIDELVESVSNGLIKFGKI